MLPPLELFEFGELCGRHRSKPTPAAVAALGQHGLNDGGHLSLRRLDTSAIGRGSSDDQMIMLQAGILTGCSCTKR